ncbi:hypothetical protein Hgul01_00949 [Herpetosiphon gulosus]|uniref:Uncharacterized protein n=2 Tax=Herpetosiphon gulosus TaxID=1973496 RepID=A0ABP9WVC5_9CHLR
MSVKNYSFNPVKKMNNPRIAEICSKLSRFYYLWNTFNFNEAFSISKELFNQILQFSNLFVTKFNIDLNILQNQMTTIDLLHQNNRLKLLWNFFFTAERYEKNNQNDISALLYYRTIESIFDNALKDISENFDRSNPNYETLSNNPEELKNDFIRIKSEYTKRSISNLPKNLSLVDSYCLLEAAGSELMKNNQKFQSKRVIGVSETRNVSIYAHGITPMNKNSVEKIKNLAIDILLTYINIKGIESIEHERENFQFLLLDNKQ